MERKYTKQDKEAWFQYYWSLGSKRNYKLVAEYFGVGIATISRTAQKENWDKRVKELEEELKKEMQEALKEEARKNIKRYFDEILKFQEVISKSLEEFIKENGKIPIRGSRDLKNIAETFKTIYDIEVSLGEGTKDPITVVIAKELLPKAKKLMEGSDGEEEQKEEREEKEEEITEEDLEWENLPLQ